MQKNSKNISTISLIIANLVPLAGVLFWDWSIFQIFLLYWAESGVIGFYNIPKMLIVSIYRKGLAVISDKPTEIISNLDVSYPKYLALGLGIFDTIFFIIHFGVFLVAHLAFINGVFGNIPEMTGGELFPPIQFFIALLYSISGGLISLFISHTISFFSNFIGQKEYLNTTISRQMYAPYPRVLVMHVSIILGGIATQLLGFKAAAFVVLIICKTVLDLILHKKEHQPKSPTLV